MRREQQETQERRVGHWFGELEREIAPLADDDLRALAREATSRPRPLPRAPRARRWPLQPRWTGLLVLALVVAIGLGAALGALVAPSSTAAPAPVGTGFLPSPGWTVLQTGSDATPIRQALAVAANVPLHPEDSARGIRESSGLPYSTLLELPHNGVVIVALFTRREYELGNEELYPKRELPLRIRDAIDGISYSYQMRPERPLGQYELRATVGNHHLALHFYFGSARPSPQLIAAAQSQLDRLIVASVSGERMAFARRPNSSVAPSASRTIDGTLLCETFAIGGANQIEIVASPAIRTLKRSASISATSYGTLGGVSQYGMSLSGRCKSTVASVSLSSRGLTPEAVSYEVRYDCFTARRVLVRAKGIFRSPATLRRGSPYNEPLLFAWAPINEGQLAIGTESGKTLVYGSFAKSGKTRLFLARDCERDYQR